MVKQHAVENRFVEHSTGYECDNKAMAMRDFSTLHTCGGWDPRRPDVPNWCDAGLQRQTVSRVATLLELTHSSGQGTDRCIPVGPCRVG